MTKIQTYSGRMVDVKNFTRDDVVLADIVIPLSRIARFNGHTKVFYSVAHHSVVVSLLVEALVDARAWKDPNKRLQAMRWGLFHDAHEAWLGDVPSPFKSMTGDLNDCAFEIDKQIQNCFGLSLDKDIYEIVKLADLQALAIERRDLLAHKLPWAFDLPLRDDVFLVCGCYVPDIDMQSLFKARYNELFCVETQMAQEPRSSNLWGEVSYLHKRQPPLETEPA